MDPLLFINKCESYVIEEEKVWLASFNMDAATQQWYMRLQREEGTPPWRRFTELLNLRFGPPIQSNPLGELAACRRSGSVEDYSTRFLDLLARAGPLSEGQQVQLFTAGLQEPLSIDVQIQNPLTLEVAISLARAYERREQVAVSSRVDQGAGRQQRRGGLLPMPPRPSLVLPAPTTSRPESSSTAAARATMVAGRTVKKLSLEEMEECRRLGLCFNCDEHYVRRHNRQCKHLFLLEIDDGDEEPAATEEEQEESAISLHAMAGIQMGDTMKVAISLGASTLQALLDSGSTHNFISEVATARCGLRFEARTGMRVAVGNGERLSGRLTINTEEFTADLFVHPLAGYDVVLGTQWLASVGPILWDFSRRTMAFWWRDHHVEWTGLDDPPRHRLHALSSPMALEALL
ncbi:hypothetical protein U9M48_000760 [Paspalum notatum var. saurae]|uniref:Retrotransposon gag domain-containing protein n=1 Tax=Paspalum notatum var. saurae TaxID=547442 RepID=A0AAQ3PF61_PASNO